MSSMNELVIGMSRGIIASEIWSAKKLNPRKTTQKKRLYNNIVTGVLCVCVCVCVCVRLFINHNLVIT